MTMTTKEQEAILTFARTSANSVESESELMLALEPSVTAWLRDGISLDACKQRVYKAVEDYAASMNKGTDDFRFIEGMMEQGGRTQLGRVVKNIERRQVVGPIFKESGVDIDLATMDFLSHWGRMSKAALEADMTLVAMVQDLAVPAASKRGVYKGQLTRSTVNAVLAALKPAAPAPSNDDDDPSGDDDSNEDDGNDDNVEIPQGSLTNLWLDFESKVFPQKDTMADEERQYLLDGMQGLIKDLTVS